MNRSLDLGMMTNHKLSESTGQSPKLSESTEHSSRPVIPNPYLPHYQGAKVLGYWVTTWINKVLVCYPNPDPILAGLSNSTQKYPNHSTLQGYQGIIIQSSSSS
jgi:hypothetical protein